MKVGVDDEELSCALFAQAAPFYFPALLPKKYNQTTSFIPNNMV